MEYYDLQKALKVLKKDGLTQVKLNAKASVLQVEYNRLQQEGFISNETELDSPRATYVASSSAPELIEQNFGWSADFPADPEAAIQLAPEIAAAVAESWTDDPTLVIATVAAYSVAGFAMVVLLIALIATSSVLLGLKCWCWWRQQLADLSLQLRYCELPFERSIQAQLLSIH